MLLYISLVVAVLSATGFQSLKQISLASIVHLGAWLITLSVACIGGQQLIDDVLHL